MSTTEQSLRDALKQLLENTDTPPDRNCSCHLSPPCGDCFDYGGVRASIQDAQAALALPVSQPEPRPALGITADWVLGYLNTDAPEEARDAVRNAFTEYAALASDRPKAASGLSITESDREVLDGLLKALPNVELNGRAVAMEVLGRVLDDSLDTPQPAEQVGGVHGDVMVMEALAYFERVGDAGDHKYVEAIRAALSELVVAKVYAGGPGPYLDEPDAPSNPLWKRLRSIANWLTLMAPNCHMEAAELLLSASDHIKRSEIAPQVGEALVDALALIQRYDDARAAYREVESDDRYDDARRVELRRALTDARNKVVFALAARQPGAQERVAWASTGATGHKVVAMPGLHKLPYGDYDLYAAPPAQGIDLEPFRPFVQDERTRLAGRAERYDMLGPADALQAIQTKITECDRLLRVINGQPGAAPTLWCIHILGPDDVYPAPSKEHAEKAAAAHNAHFKEHAARLDINVEAVVAPWPHDAASHAAGVAEFIPSWLIPKWQTIALENDNTPFLQLLARMRKHRILVLNMYAGRIEQALGLTGLVPPLADGQQVIEAPYLITGETAVAWMGTPKEGGAPCVTLDGDTLESWTRWGRTIEPLFRGVLAVADQAAVGKVLDDRTCWNGQRPPVGSDLYAAPQAPAEGARDTARLDWLEQNGCMRFHGPHEHQRGPGYTWFDSETTDSDYSPTLRDAIDAVLAIEHGVTRG